MKKRARAALCALCLALTGLLAAAFPRLCAHFASRAVPAPPGVTAARRELLTVWTLAPLPGAAEWLRACARDFTRAHPGATVWLRAASSDDLRLLASDFDAAAPDLICFAAGVAVPVDALAETAAGDSVCGQWEERQLCVPLCLSGYVLATRAQAATPAPRGLFGVTPTPAPLPSAPPSDGLPQSIVAPDDCGAWALLAMDAPAGARFAAAEEVYAAFLNGEAALLPLSALARAQAQGVAGVPLAAAPVTDLVFYGARTRRGGALAEDFLTYLCSEEAQRALAARMLLPARWESAAFGAGQEACAAAAQALSGASLPNAFTWPEERKALLESARALYGAGGKKGN